MKKRERKRDDREAPAAGQVRTREQRHPQPSRQPAALHHPRSRPRIGCCAGVAPPFARRRCLDGPRLVKRGGPSFLGCPRGACAAPPGASELPRARVGGAVDEPRASGQFRRSHGAMLAQRVGATSNQLGPRLAPRRIVQQACAGDEEGARLGGVNRHVPRWLNGVQRVCSG